MQVDMYIANLDQSIAPLRWEHSVSEHSQHFLDIDITAIRCGNSISFDTCLYRKPNFSPHYLAVLSEHPACHKSGIFSCEEFRAMLLCSRECAFIGCIDKLIGFLNTSGYPDRCFAPVQFSESRRLAFFEKMLRREPMSADSNSGTLPSNKCRRHNVFFTLPYSSQAHNLRVAGIFRQSVGNIIPITLLNGWSVKPNSMRRLYRLNWPRVQSQSMGSG